MPNTVDSVGFRWPDTAKGPWKVVVYVDTSEGVPRCVGVDLRSFDGHPAGPKPVRALPGGLRELTATEWREISPVELLGEAVEDLKGLASHFAADASGDEAQALRERADIYGLRGRYDLDHYKSVAQVYRAAFSTGAPTRAVAETLGLSRSAASNHVGICRDIGLLPRTVKGRANVERKVKR